MNPNQKPDPTLDIARMGDPETPPPEPDKPDIDPGEQPPEMPPSKPDEISPPQPGGPEIPAPGPDQPELPDPGPDQPEFGPNSYGLRDSPGAIKLPPIA